MEIPKPVRKFKAIKEVVARFDLEFEAIKSPRDAYEEKVAAVNASIEEAWEQLSSNSNPSNKSRLQNEIVRHGGQLRELEIKHNATFEDEERGYGQQLQAAMKKLCDDLIETIGLSLVEESLQTLAARQSSQRDGDGPLGGLKSASTSQETTREELNRSAGLHKSGLEASSEESILVQVCTDKRKNNFSGSPRERKRRQIDREPPLAEAKKTIDFEEVFQDGRARTKHVIVQFPTGVGAWYILQCPKHDLSFKDNPMERAATHLSGKEHGWSSQEPAVVVIKHLGVQVLGCNKTLANKNNSVALKEFQSGDEQSDAHSRPTKDHGPSSVIKTLRRPTRHSRRRHGDGNQLRDQDFEGIIDPTPGEVYLAFWKNWSAVLLLPMSNLDDVGVTGSLESLGLAENVPTCYDYDTQANTFEWREGYKTGQSLITEREFPVMYFDGQNFPAKSAVGWVAARDLRIFDAKAGPSLVPYYQSVRKFLRHRASTRSVEIEDVEPDALGTGLLDETQNQPTPPLAPREAHGSPEHTISDAQDNPGTPSLAETFNTGRPASLPRNMRQANPSSEPQGTSQNDHFDVSHEIISINTSPLEERLEEPSNANGSHIPLIAGEVPNGTVHMASLVEQSRPASHKRGGHRANTIAATMSKVSDLAQAALDTLHQPASTPTNRSTVLVDERQILPVHHSPQTTGPIPADISAWPRPFQPISVAFPQPKALELWGTEPSAHRAASEQTRDTAQSPLPPGTPQTSQGSASAGVSSGLSRDSMMNSPPAQPHHILPAPRLPNPGFISAGPTGVPGSSGTSLASYYLPPIAASRRSDTVPHTIPTFQWSSSGTISQVENPDVPTSSYPGAVYFQAAPIPLLDSHGQVAMHTSVPNETPTVSSVAIQPTLQTPTGGTSPDMSAWPYTLPEGMLNHLVAYLRRNNRVLGMDGLKNTRGFYNCPLCANGRRKDYVRAGCFMSHLRNHWISLSRPQESCFGE